MQTMVTHNKLKKQVNAYNILITMSHVHLTVQCYHNDYIISEMDFGSHCKYKKKRIIYIWVIKTMLRTYITKHWNNL